ncbi:MAG TPA: hypothetical protein PKD55_22485 [Bellilinea sp.]|nr:hypothetical protein [Bellilinea sp.]
MTVRRLQNAPEQIEVAQSAVLVADARVVVEIAILALGEDNGDIDPRANEGVDDGLWIEAGGNPLWVGDLPTRLTGFGPVGKVHVKEDAAQVARVPLGRITH